MIRRSLLALALAALAVVVPAVAFAAVPSGGSWKGTSSRDVNGTFSTVRFKVADAGATIKNVKVHGNWDCAPPAGEEVGDEPLTLTAPDIKVSRSSKFAVVDPVDIRVKATGSREPVTGHGTMSFKGSFASTRAGKITFKSTIAFTKADGTLYATCKSPRVGALTLKVKRSG